MPMNLRTPALTRPRRRTLAALLLCLGAITFTLPVQAVRDRHAGPRLEQPSKAIVQSNVAAAAYDDVWTAQQDMHVSRAGHVAQALPDGRVLVAGGTGDPGGIQATAEIFDPSTNTWTMIDPMHSARLSAKSVFLPPSADLPAGAVFVASGYRHCLVDEACTDASFAPNIGLGSAEYYDLATGTWVEAANQFVPTRSRNFTLNLLGDGRVALVGGTQAYNTYQSAVNLYDPATNLWTSGPSLDQPRDLHTATTLADGRLLVVGGYNGNTGQVLDTYTLFDGATWSPAAPLPGGAVWGHAAARLANGQVLVTGGWAGFGASAPLATTMLFDPTTGWSVLTPLVHPRGVPALVALDDGTALVTDGCATPPQTCSGVPTDIEPTTERWSAADGWTLEEDLITRRLNTQLVALPGAAALSTGGYDDINHASAKVELYGSPAPPPVLPTYPEFWQLRSAAPSIHDSHVAEALPDGRVLVAGGIGSNAAEIYDSGTDSWVAALPMAGERRNAVSVSLPDGDILVIGGFQQATQPLAACATVSDDFGGPTGYTDLANSDRYDVATGTWSLSANCMGIGRSRYHAAARLGDGRVVVIGGVHQYGEHVANVDIYDPVTNAWTPGPPLPAARYLHTATTLPDGRILVAGGHSGGTAANDYLIFNGTSWTTPRPLPGYRWGHAVVRLANGDLLLSGGTTGFGPSQPRADTWLYRPATDTWQVVAPLHHARFDHRMVALDDGTVLVAGGCAVTVDTCDGDLADQEASSERWSPADGWTVEENLNVPRLSSTLTALPGAAALSVGGRDAPGHYVATTELYDAPIPPSVTGDPSLAPATVIALPALNYLGLDWTCRSWVQVQNAGMAATRAIMLAWGEADSCATTPGPLGVACSGLIAPGSAWSFPDNALPGGKRSGVVYSIADGSYGGDNIGDTVCAHLSTDVDTAADYRAFQAAYVGDGTVAGIPMSAARGEPLAVVAYRSCPADITPGRDVTSAYEGISDRMLATPDSAGQPRYRYQVPLVLADTGGMNSQLYFQNMGLDCASLTLSFRAQDSCLPATVCAFGAVAVPAAQVMSFDPSDCVGSDWSGSMEVRSDMPLAITADLYGRDSLSTYRGVSQVPSPGADELIGPLYHSPETGWDTLVQVQNLGQSASDARVTFHRSDGTVEASVVESVCAGASQTFPLPVSFDAPVDQTGWIGVESLADGSGARQPLAAITRLVKYSDAQRSEVREASAYNLLPLPELASAAADLPFVFKDLEGPGLTSEVQLAAGPQFAGGSSGTENIRHEYFDPLGSVAQYVLPLTQGRSSYQDLSTIGSIPTGLSGSLVLAGPIGRARFAAAGVVRVGTRIGEDIPGDEAATFVGIPRLMPACAPAPGGMVAWWPFDEASGNMTADIAGNEHDAAVGYPIWHPDGGAGSAEVRGALEFTGTPDTEVTVPDAPELRFGTGDFSVDFWIKFPAGGDTYSHTGILQKRQFGGGPHGFYSVDVRLNRYELKIVRSDAVHNYYFTASGAVVSGSWQHVAITVDHADLAAPVKFYVNGNRVSVFNIAGDALWSMVPAFDVGNFGPLVMGGGTTGALVGTLDEMQLFDRAISAAEVKAIFDAGSTGSCLPAATPTPTDVPSDTPTPSATWTPTPTDTPTPSITPTPTPTATYTPSITPSPTATHTPTFTPTSTYTPTPTFTPNPLCAPLPADLAAWWSLDETEGTLATDRSSNHNDGSVNGSLGWDADGKVLASFRFSDASARFIQVPDANSIDVGSGNFSINAWVKLPVAPPGAYSTILDKRTMDGTVVRGYAFFLAGKTLGLQLADGKFANYIANAGVPADNAWHHIGVTVQRTTPRVIRFYVDGLVSPTKFYPSATLGTLDNTAPLRIGRHVDPSSGYFDGLMDELQLHRRTLTAGQMNAIYRAGSAGVCPPLP